MGVVWCGVVERAAGRCGGRRGLGGTGGGGEGVWIWVVEWGSKLVESLDSLCHEDTQSCWIQSGRKDVRSGRGQRSGCILFESIMCTRKLHTGASSSTNFIDHF